MTQANNVAIESSQINSSGVLQPAGGGTGVTTTTGSGNAVLSTSPTLVTPVIGTPSSGTLTSCTGLPLTTGVTGTLPIANGGTGSTTAATVAGTGISVSGTFPNQTVTNSGVTSIVAGTGISISGATGAVTIASSPATGSVVQVVSTTKVDTFSSTSTTFTDITGLSVTITPSSASNKILVIYNFQAAVSSGEYACGFQLVRNSTAICTGTASSNRYAATNFNVSSGVTDQSWAMGMNFLDSPATTSAITYKVQGLAQSGGTFVIGRTVADTDTTRIARFPSTITVMEIKG
jgi:hypothetical protein